MISVRLRSYRPFTEASEADIGVAPGFTALVGPNNSGKTAFLRSIYELRRLFGSLREEKTLRKLVANPAAVSFSVEGVRDPEELRPNQTNAPVSVRIATDEPGVPIFVEASEDGDMSFQVALFQGPDQEPLRELQGGELILRDASRVSLTSVAQGLGVLADAAYVGPFRSVIGAADPYYDLSIGHAFISTWNDWKTGDSLELSRKTQQVTESIRDVFGYGSLDISQSNNGKEIQISVDGHAYRLRELGAGLSQFILVACSMAVRRPSLILIDEPETNLHPRLQAEFLTLIGSYATLGVVFATHSVGLARSIADRIYAFSLTELGTRVTTLDTTPRFAEFLGEMSFSGYRALGYSCVLLVEGVTDVRLVRQWLRQLRADHMGCGHPVGGRRSGRGWPRRGTGRDYTLEYRCVCSP